MNQEIIFKKRKKFLKIGILLSPFFFMAQSVQAHCPLCTVGIAAAAGGAAYLGVDKSVIGLFVGAFAVSTGWWVANKIKKRYIPYQKPLLILISFLLTVFPLLPLLERIYPLFISFFGEYGSIFNRTYVFNLSLITSMVGGIVVSISPWLSKLISFLRNKKPFLFQGAVLTIVLLIFMAVLVQMVV